MHIGAIAKTSSSDELAFVVGHEVAHYLADHSREKSRNRSIFWSFLLPPLIPVLPFAIAASTFRPPYKAVFRTAFIIPIAVACLGYQYQSRIIESEADQIGVMLMAEAGYNPEAAATLLQSVLDSENELLRQIPISLGWISELPIWSHPSVSMLCFNPCIQRD